LKKQRKFLVAGGLVTGLVGYLMVTGMRDSMVYYHTPTELLEKVATDPGYHDLGVKVGGRVVPGSVTYDNRTLDLRFLVADIETADPMGAAEASTGEMATFQVSYQGALPDTFTEGVDVVVEGRFTREGVFEATVLLTKCGSRYEAGIEDYLTT